MTERFTLEDAKGELVNKCMSEIYQGIGDAIKNGCQAYTHYDTCHGENIKEILTVDGYNVEIKKVQTSRVDFEDVIFVSGW